MKNKFYLGCYSEKQVLNDEKSYLTNSYGFNAT